MKITRIGVGLAVVCAALFPVCGRGESPDRAVALTLAVELAEAEQHESSAVEWRRLALSEPAPSARGAYFWMAAWEYGQATNLDVVSPLLGRAEETAPELESQALLLRAECAWKQGQQEASVFYWRAVADNPRVSPETKQYAMTKLAAAYVRSGKPADARTVLDTVATNQADTRLTAIRDYEQGHDRRPLVGGILGIVPGLGYAYSGEYANGLRSLLLNGLFIFGMVDTAGDDEWGAFAVISFFEVTWFTGSIYGGVDAAQRYNERRLNECMNDVQGQASFEPEFGKLPVISLKFAF
ncbi:MAG: hypothetical protein HY343_03690 [Lentisphaerae bacterium]|nr:hypothetical protein [Lentisphaerota bacterium]